MKLIFQSYFISFISDWLLENNANSSSSVIVIDETIFPDLNREYFNWFFKQSNPSPNRIMWNYFSSIFNNAKS